jgi:hypothetical protein
MPEIIPELPLTLVQALERRLVTATSLASSPFTGGEQVQDWGGEWWEYSLEMARTTGRDGRRLSAFFAALGGPRGRFLFRDLDLHRFCSGLLRAILAIKEIGYGSDTQRRVQAGCSSHCAHQWPDTASGCV